MESILESEHGKVSREDTSFELPHSEPIDSPQNNRKRAHNCIICGNILGKDRRRTCSDECQSENRLRQHLEYTKKRREKDLHGYLEYFRQYRKKNKDRIRKRDKRKRLEHPEKYKEKGKRMYAKHKEKLLAHNKIYYQNNKDKIYQKHLEYIKTPEGKIAIRNKTQRRRFSKTHIIESFDGADLQKLIGMCNGICPKCGREGEITVDHILPISKAPTWHIYTIDDVQPLCRSCNSSKGNSLIWLQK